MSAFAKIQHRSSDTPTMSAACLLMQLQNEQFQHDESFHREVARLDVKSRLTHMALHFAKYVGYLGSHARNAEHAPALNRIIVDCFIIALSSANILNIRMAEQIKLENIDCLSVDEIANELRSLKCGQKFDVAWLLSSLAIPAGKMAKACEALDHLEALSYRDEMVSAISEIARVTLAAASARDIDLPSEIRTRLRKIKEKSIFYTPTGPSI